MRTRPDPVRLSKAVAHALRHAPGDYGLQLDADGWTTVDALLEGLRARSPHWRNLEHGDLAGMVRRSPKRRFEMTGSRIRALYGHSVPERINRVAARPPGRLFHGTSLAAADRITTQGLLPMNRQYVHLSVDRETAVQVGRRRTRTPVVLEVDAAAASAAGVCFYEGQDLVWLADRVPPQFLTRT